MPDFISVNNIYQLLAFLIVAGLQVYTKWGVDKLANGQVKLQGEIEATRAEMFRRAKSNGSNEGYVATIEQALKVAYLQGKADAKRDVPYPQERIADAAHKLAEQAGGSHAPTPDVQAQAPETAATP